MSITALRNKTPQQIKKDLNSFSKEYVTDWDSWLDVEDSERWYLFGKILRSWQATRPKKMRRLRNEAQHEPPYLDDLLRKAKPHVESISQLTLQNFHKITPVQHKALCKLWAIFEQLPVNGTASCVGITKAVMLLTNGRIGPALDSQVRLNLGVAKPTNPKDWIILLKEIGDDVIAFEKKNRLLLKNVVPKKFAHLEYGRLYDMVLGPR